MISAFLVRLCMFVCREVLEPRLNVYKSAGTLNKPEKKCVKFFYESNRKGDEK